jgi:cytochrome c551
VQQQVGDFAKAEQIYINICMVCHGAALEGGIGPNLQHIGSRRTKEEIIDQIANGRGLMPAFRGQLDPATILLLAEWLYSKK